MTKKEKTPEENLANMIGMLNKTKPKSWYNKLQEGLWVVVFTMLPIGIIVFLSKWIWSLIG